ncbi:hypothetical protein N7495_008652 [Penicillium taxi]|uniref:uncharacterized protein n=1 Tax=Penicillium taxi TaxID=168475 RepID=UPI0025454DBB|nr:uncharacterized protein N7495_008652 [Penicillium taxi]KAJ5888611.1 hypothetical protein N7495_008652 [Penicillium taxi]
MNYNSTDCKGRKFTLAIVRVPAKVPVSDPRYGGAVLINPGGPGGSGTLQAFISGRNLQTIIDAEDHPDDGPVKKEDKYFDIIGFDPRGVGSTTPAVACFPDPNSQRNWELQVEAEGMLGSRPDSLWRNWQYTQALNSGCSVWEMTATHENETMMSYLNTPLVAQDMITIIERHGEWREAEGKKAQATHDKCHGADKTQSIIKRTRWHRNEEPLFFWGRSYGTLLGATFAALFPDRVARAVLDGVVNMDKYYRDTGPNVVMDADAIFDRFGFYCDAAGRDACPFYIEGGPEAIKNTYWTIEEQVLNMSNPVMASFTRGPEVVTWTDLKALLRAAIYQPLLSFRLFADTMGALAEGNFIPMADFKHRSHFSACASSACSIAGPWSPACVDTQDNSLYASSAIMCTDAEYLTEHTVETFQKNWDGLKADSATLGDYWSQLQLACVGWKAKAKYRFDGPWGSVTAHPMLLVSNILDPVTPLWSAKHMSKLFPGSSVLQQDSEGHTTIAAPSICVAKEIRKYFQTGILPQSGTLCAADVKPLIGHDQAKLQGLSPSDQSLLDVLIAEVEHGFRPHQFL